MITFFIKHFGRYYGHKINRFKVMTPKENFMISFLVPLQLLFIKFITYMYTTCELEISFLKKAREYVPESFFSGIFYGIPAAIDHFVNCFEDIIYNMLYYHYFYLDEEIPHLKWIIAGMIIISFFVARDLVYLIYHFELAITIFWAISFCYDVKFIAYGIFKSDSVFVLIFAWIVCCILWEMVDKTIDHNSMITWSFRMSEEIDHEEYHPQKHGLNMRKVLGWDDKNKNE